MANTSLGGGLRKVGSNGYMSRRVPTPYFCTQAADIGIGDCVTHNSTSNTATVVASVGKVGGHVRFKPGQIRAVVRSTAGDTNKITGVVQNVAYSPTVAFASSVPYHVSGGTDVLYVDDDPSSIFEIECNDTIAAADVGLNANLDSGATVDAHSGRSNLKLDVSSKGVDATKQLTILGISKAINRGDLGSSGCSVYVKINLHTEASNTAGA